MHEPGATTFCPTVVTGRCRRKIRCPVEKMMKGEGGHKILGKIIEKGGESTRNRGKGIEIHRWLWEKKGDVYFRRCWNDLWNL